MDVNEIELNRKVLYNNYWDGLWDGMSGKGWRGVMVWELNGACLVGRREGEILLTFLRLFCLLRSLCCDRYNLTSVASTLSTSYNISIIRQKR